MTKADFADALLPLLIAQLPEPFNPRANGAEQAVKAANEWAELVHAAKSKASGYNLKNLMTP